MRARVHFVAIVLAVVTMTAFAYAEPVSSLKPTDCVNDFAGVLDSRHGYPIEESAGRSSTAAQATVVVATVKSTDGEDIFNYSVEMYQNGESGRKARIGRSDPAWVQDRKYFLINVGYGLEPILPTGKLAALSRSGALPAARRLRRCGEPAHLARCRRDAGDAGVEITTSQPRRIEMLVGPHEAQLSPGAIIA
jgi:uncharacterized protein